MSLLLGFMTPLCTVCVVITKSHVYHKQITSTDKTVYAFYRHHEYENPINRGSVVTFLKKTYKTKKIICYSCMKTYKSERSQSINLLSSLVYFLSLISFFNAFTYVFYSTCFFMLTPSSIMLVWLWM